MCHMYGCHETFGYMLTLAHIEFVNSGALLIFILYIYIYNFSSEVQRKRQDTAFKG